MSKYIDNNLLPGENITYQGIVHAFYTIPLYIGFIIGLIFFLTGIFNGIGFATSIGLALILGFLYKIYFLQTRDIYVTDKRFIFRDGLIINNSFELSLDKIESIKIEQDFIERLLKGGKIIISGIGGNNIIVEYIASPEVMKKIIYEEINKTKKVD
ncbi:PH domain-containing protein [Candidatus Gracilibacteria bacterium]|nr:PH domain-containing protein [Candidatus Gracilibacteria bacterium]